jgi:hypothetical protein
MSEDKAGGGVRNPPFGGQAGQQKAGETIAGLACHEDG